MDKKEMLDALERIHHAYIGDDLNTETVWQSTNVILRTILAVLMLFVKIYIQTKVSE